MGIKNWINKYREKRAIKNIRRIAFLYGYDLSDLTDEEIEKRVVDSIKTVSKIGVTAEEMVRSLKILGNSINPAEKAKTAMNKIGIQSPATPGQAPAVFK